MRHMQLRWLALHRFDRFITLSKSIWDLLDRYQTCGGKEWRGRWWCSEINMKGHVIWSVFKDGLVWDDDKINKSTMLAIECTWSLPYGKASITLGLFLLHSATEPRVPLRVLQLTVRALGLVSAYAPPPQKNLYHPGSPHPRALGRLSITAHKSKWWTLWCASSWRPELCAALLASLHQAGQQLPK